MQLKVQVLLVTVGGGRGGGGGGGGGGGTTTAALILQPENPEHKSVLTHVHTTYYQ